MPTTRNPQKAWNEKLARWWKDYHRKHDNRLERRGGKMYCELARRAANGSED